ncbi:MAG TPA: carboxypeptidase-like regulatory domain-containing protein [Candidatus Acidoferrales bacterium]|nr:carboxypeptidase-like regulatory domain-containing protein [Candidatus Acidoferrales bacterium]
MKRNARWLLIVCAALALSATLWAYGLGTLAGRVVDANGKPVAGASVVMQSSAGAMPYATTTNEHGRFFFPRLPHGYYDVRATTRLRASAWKHNLTVRTGKQTEVTLRLTIPVRQRR